jgi:thymidine kinase
MNNGGSLGEITIIFGPMFSGKSTELLKRVRRLELQKKKCLVVNYNLDNRYSAEDVVSTHDKIMVKAVKRNRLEEILDIYNDYDVIAIDEGQFFPDVKN